MHQAFAPFASSTRTPRVSSPWKQPCKRLRTILITAECYPASIPAALPMPTEAGGQVFPFVYGDGPVYITLINLRPCSNQEELSENLPEKVQKRFHEHGHASRSYSWERPVLQLSFRSTHAVHPSVLGNHHGCCDRSAINTAAGPIHRFGYPRSTVHSFIHSRAIVHSFTMVATLFSSQVMLSWLLLLFTPTALSVKIYLCGDSTMAKSPNGIIQGTF